MRSTPGWADQANHGFVEPPNTAYQQHAPAGYAMAAPGQQLIPAPAPSGLDSGTDVPSSLMERIRMCEFLAEADLLPRSLQKKPANLLLIMQKASALAVPVAVAIEHFHVIDGQVGYSAELLRALLFRNGHILRWPSISDKEVTGELTLRHDPNNPRIARFTMADATRMKLAGKDNWQKDPESMLVARCTTRLVSRHCPEVAVALGNLSAMDMDTEDTAVVPVAATAEVDRDKMAEEIHQRAEASTDVDEVKAMGLQAKADGLMERAVSTGDTLQVALLRRHAHLTEQADAAKTAK